MAVNNRPALRSYADVASMPTASPNGSVAWSIADNAFAVKIVGTWTLLNPIAGSAVANVADNQAGAGVPVVHNVAVPDGATGDVDVVITEKMRVTAVRLVKTGGAGGASDTITVKNGTTAITNAMDINVADQTVVRAGTINDASWEIAAAGTLRVTRTKASGANVACLVIVEGVRVA